jgi:hydrogenase nickel incorporation protein HypA/HybF
VHELPVTESILEISLRRAKEANATRITGLYLVIGQLSSLVDDSIQFYWDIIAKDTIAEGAILHFRRIPAEFQCMACATMFRPDGEDLSCPSCGNIGARIAAGDEFFLEAIDVENPESSSKQGESG